MQKRSMTWIFTVFLTIGAALPAVAAPELTLGWLGSNDDMTYHTNESCVGSAYSQSVDETTKFSGVLLGVKYPLDRWDFNLEYGRGSSRDDGEKKQNYDMLNLTTGYRLFEQERWNVSSYLGRVDLDFSPCHYRGTTLGVAAHYQLTSRIGLDAASGYLVKSDLTYDDVAYNDTKLWNYRLQLTYQLNDQFNLGLGYRSYQYSGDNSSDKSKRVDGSIELVTLTATYKFPFKSCKSADSGQTTAESTAEIAPTPTPAPTVVPAVESVATTEALPAPVEAPSSIPENPKSVRFLTSVYFKSNSTVIQPKQKAALDRALFELQAKPQLLAIIGGHTDASGNRNYNLKMSRHRAQNVANYLIAHGIKRSRITVYAYGEDYPAKTPGAAHAQAERRVDIIIMVTSPTKEQGIQH